MKERKASQQEKYCPICGSELPLNEKNNPAYYLHRCPNSILGAIDAANTRASRADEDDSRLTEPAFLDQPSFTQRLRDGFRTAQASIRD